MDIKTLQNNDSDQTSKEYYARKYNNDKNENIGTPEVVINQYPENQTIYPRKRIVPGTNSNNEKHWLTLEQTVTTSEFSVTASQKVYELNK